MSVLEHGFFFILDFELGMLNIYLRTNPRLLIPCRIPGTSFTVLEDHSQSHDGPKASSSFFSWL